MRGYPLVSRLLQAVSEWLDSKDDTEHWVRDYRNRIVQMREAFSSLDDFEGILGMLEEYGHSRVKPRGPTTYRQDTKDIFHDCAERMRGVDLGNSDTPATGFYPQYLRRDLISALREYFHEIETNCNGEIAYGSLARRIDPASLIITLNYDVALERSLAKAGKWNIGTGYGFTAFTGRVASPTTVYKLHGRTCRCCWLPSRSGRGADRTDCQLQVACEQHRRRLILHRRLIPVHAKSSYTGTACPLPTRKRASCSSATSAATP